MKYMVIGLGIYGNNLARDLTMMGNEVIGVDRSDIPVDSAKDFISTVYRVDTTDEAQMGVLPLKSVDVVIVAIGEDFGASIRTIAILRRLGVKHIYARAIDPLHRSILECFNIDRILTPEQRAASDLTMEMLLGSQVETLTVDTDNLIVKFTAPDYFVGDAYISLKLLDELRIKVITATRPREQTNIIGVKVMRPAVIDVSQPDAVVEAGDIFVCLASRNAFRELMKRTSTEDNL